THHRVTECAELGGTPRIPHGSPSPAHTPQQPHPGHPWQRCPNAPGALAASGPTGIPEYQTGLGWKDLKAHAIPPLPWQGHLPLSQAAPSPVQPGLGHSQGSRGSHSFSGHPLPGPAHPCSTELPPHIPSNPALFHFEAIPPFPVSPGPLSCQLPSGISYLPSMRYQQQVPGRVAQKFLKNS
ncbi:unnamed protein product, partial [Coccothraustes coccothraustes]